MNIQIIYSLFIPFIGTTLGAACVFLLKKQLNDKIQRALIGFAAGVMVAASIWSLLIPAIDASEAMGKLSFIPAVVGFLIGMFFLLILDKTIPHMHLNNECEGARVKLKKNTMLMMAVTLHNIPEGMAVGVVLASALYSKSDVTIIAALTLAIGIAIQNFPEGAIISMPLKANGESTLKSFLLGALSGIVEPIASFITLIFAGLVVPILPYLLSFAAGAMMYVVIEELIPEMSEAPHSNIGTILFSIGFVIMMILDVALG